MKRKPLSKRLRFDVFKRDSFTCQYCGKKSPEVVLHVDHVHPVSKGGENDILNLVTACSDCNGGKSDRELSDDSAVWKKRAQLDALQEKRDQLDMLLEWQRGLLNLDEQTVEGVASIWKELADPFALNEHGLKELRKTLKKYGVEQTISAMRTAVDEYAETAKVDGVDVFTSESINKAWRYVARICSVALREKDEPNIRKLFYIRGIVRNRVYHCNEHKALELLREADGSGVSIEEMREVALGCSSWTDWQEEMWRLIEREGEG